MWPAAAGGRPGAVGPTGSSTAPARASWTPAVQSPPALTTPVISMTLNHQRHITIIFSNESQCL